jgi:methanogenic corrinoid protein MtbC1
MPIDFEDPAARIARSSDFSSVDGPAQSPSGRSALADTLSIGDLRLFLDHVEWLKVTMLARGARDADVERVLESLRPSSADSESHPLVEAALDLLPVLGAEPAACFPSGGAHDALATHYLDLLLTGRRRDAEELILSAAKSGVPVPEIYLDVFEPALHEVGRLWQLDRITVAQEHFCTAATQSAMSRLYPWFLSGQPRRRRMIAACVGDELHEVGLRMVTDLLEMDGWDTFYAGASVPAASLVETAVESGVKLIALSVTRTAHLPRLRETIGRIRDHEALRHTAILVGGRPFAIAPDLAQRLGADGWAPSAASAVTLAGSFCS